jgi:glycosylphosphatidylinositol transamidase (GPIT) subunit GPI8
MLKPVSPYISDAVAHIFYYTQHMATVHYENGKYHVHKELVDNAKKGESSKEPSASKKENSANDHIAIQQKQSVQVLPVNISYHASSASNLLNNYLAGDYPPPRA